MPKTIRSYEDLYIAPDILGGYSEGEPFLIDKKGQFDLELNPNNIDDKIKVYERQVKGWFLDNARNLLDKKHNSFVSFMIAVSYIEGVEQYKSGQSSNGKSLKFFKRSFKKIFGRDYPDDKIKAFYKEARCGLFHVGMTDKSLILKKEAGSAIEFRSDDIIVNPELFLNKIENDFESYISLLEDTSNNNAREKFNSFFSIL